MRKTSTLSLSLNQSDLQQLRQKLEAALLPVLPEFLQEKLHQKFIDVTIVHEPLQPEGNKFKFNIVLTVYPKKEKEDAS